MKVLQLIVTGMLAFLVSCGGNDRYEVSRHLTETEATDFKKEIIRYVAALPKKGNDMNKFEARFNEHYDKQLQLVRLDKYYPSNDGYIYFETSRIAPSFKVKRVSTGGRLRYGADKSLAEYEEIYRTWKMEEKELEEKTAVLFSKMINNEDLTPYQTANSTEEYIEFPDMHVRYDKEKRRWLGDELVLQARP